MTDDQLKNLFSYHAPFGDQAKRYELIRAAGLILAQTIQELAPESAEKTTAIRRVQESVMYANAAIACNESPRCSLCGAVIVPGQESERVAGGDVAHVVCLDRKGR